jgi:WXXGXW repeat (2 copies)
MKSVSKTLWVTLCLGAAAFSGSSVAFAGAAPEVAPPPSRDERAPAPRDGYVWAPGYWEWGGSAYTWVPGRFIYGHRGAHWVPDRWDQVGSQWQHANGHWEH